MNGNSRILGMLLMGVGAGLLTCYVQSVKKHHHRRVNKKLAKVAHQSWEGEGGAIIDPVPRTAAS